MTMKKVMCQQQLGVQVQVAMEGGNTFPHCAETEQRKLNLRGKTQGTDSMGAQTSWGKTFLKTGMLQQLLGQGQGQESQSGSGVNGLHSVNSQGQFGENQTWTDNGNHSGHIANHSILSQTGFQHPSQFPTTADHKPLNEASNDSDNSSPEEDNSSHQEAVEKPSESATRQKVFPAQLNSTGKWFRENFKALGPQQKLIEEIRNNFDNKLYQMELTQSKQYSRSGNARTNNLNSMIQTNDKHLSGDYLKYLLLQITPDREFQWTSVTDDLDHELQSLPGYRARWREQYQKFEVKLNNLKDELERQQKLESEKTYKSTTMKLLKEALEEEVQSVFSEGLDSLFLPSKIQWRPSYREVLVKKYQFFRRNLEQFEFVLKASENQENNPGFEPEVLEYMRQMQGTLEKTTQILKQEMHAMRDLFARIFMGNHGNNHEWSLLRSQAGATGQAQIAKLEARQVEEMKLMNEYQISPAPYDLNPHSLNRVHIKNYINEFQTKVGHTVQKAELSEDKYQDVFEDLALGDFMKSFPDKSFTQIDFKMLGDKKFTKKLGEKQFSEFQEYKNGNAFTVEKIGTKSSKNLKLPENFTKSIESELQQQQAQDGQEKDNLPALNSLLQHVRQVSSSALDILDQGLVQILHERFFLYFGRTVKEGDQLYKEMYKNLVNLEKNPNRIAGFKDFFENLKKIKNQVRSNNNEKLHQLEKREQFIKDTQKEMELFRKSWEKEQLKQRKKFVFDLFSSEQFWPLRSKGFFDEIYNDQNPLEFNFQQAVMSKYEGQQKKQVHQIELEIGFANLIEEKEEELSLLSQSSLRSGNGQFQTKQTEIKDEIVDYLYKKYEGYEKISRENRESWCGIPLYDFRQLVKEPSSFKYYASGRYTKDTFLTYQLLSMRNTFKVFGIQPSEDLDRLQLYQIEKAAKQDLEMSKDLLHLDREGNPMQEFRANPNPNGNPDHPNANKDHHFDDDHFSQNPNYVNPVNVSDLQPLGEADADLNEAIMSFKRQALIKKVSIYIQQVGGGFLASFAAYYKLSDLHKKIQNGKGTKGSEKDTDTKGSNSKVQPQGQNQDDQNDDQGIELKEIDFESLI